MGLQINDPTPSKLESLAITKIVKASFPCWEKSDCHQPITRDGLKEFFGKEISRDLIGRLRARGFIGTGSSLPR